jgi:NAD(P)-dependent dehydrogenase (short-subunit alcohol dehydrogenase family)
MSALLANRVAIITGAGRGLGRAHALALARSGARTVVNDVDAAAAEQVCREIADGGGEALSSSANVQDLAFCAIAPSRKSISRTSAWCSTSTSWAR